VGISTSRIAHLTYPSVGSPKKTSGIASGCWIVSGITSVATTGTIRSVIRASLLRHGSVRFVVPKSHDASEIVLSVKELAFFRAEIAHEQRLEEEKKLKQLSKQPSSSELIQLLFWH
jgi:hypothetical protein